MSKIFLIYGSEVEKHVKDIDYVLRRLRDCGMTVKLGKTEVFKREHDFLGYVISAEGIRSNRDRMESILRIPCLRIKQQVSRYIGFW